MRQIHTQPAPFVCKCLADADPPSPDFQLLRPICPKPKTLCRSTVPVVLRQTSNKQSWQTNSRGAGARTGPASPSPLHHTTPPFSRIGAEEAGRALSKTPLSSEDETRNALRLGPSQQPFRLTAPALISRVSVPRSLTHADSGRAAWQWRIESSRELTQEALSGPCCFRRLTPFNLAPYSWMRPRRGGVALTVTPLRVYGSALEPGRLDPQTK